MERVDVALRYHERTKHRPGRYAASLGYLDWASQPDPFRRYEGAPRVPLAQLPDAPAPRFDALYDGSELPIVPRDHAFVSQLLYDSLALSAWKQHGTARWSLRVNPSSGNLHPTEAYLLLPATDGVCKRPALFHYDVFRHALEQRAELELGLWTRLTQGLPPGSVLVGLTSIHWREAWKYGERAYRYCQHDAGHAIAALAFAARELGYRARILDRLDDLTIGRLLGIHLQSGVEAEHPDCLLCLAPRDAFVPAQLDGFGIAREVMQELEGLSLVGMPNVLSSEHQPWPVIDEVSAACARVPGTGSAAVAHGSSQAPVLLVREVSARALIRSRRSAVDMDGHTGLTRDAFFRILKRSMPAAAHAPWDALTWRPSLHLALFVHRVEGLEPGLYFLFRDAARAESLADCMGRDFAWVTPEATPADIPLLRLSSADARNAARMICCDQDIAANGAFAVAMMAELAPSLRTQGAHMYRRLHWEAGAIGQVLYLESEAAGLSATGIGCFFDDVMHHVLGISDARMAMLYGFTVGGRVDDPRIQTVPAYEHLRDARLA